MGLKLDCKDYGGNPIDSNTIYVDVIEKVKDISIVNEDGRWYAVPEGLDGEELAVISENLVPKSQYSSGYAYSKDITITKKEYNELLEIKAMYEDLCK